MIKSRGKAKGRSKAKSLYLNSLFSLHLLAEDLFLLTMSPTLIEFAGCIAASILLSAVYTYLTRLVWHPLAKFPGPKLAGVSRLYEVYHQVYKSDWLENLSALHDKYGRGPCYAIMLSHISDLDVQVH
jgi:hypothetical protein